MCLVFRVKIANYSSSAHLSFTEDLRIDETCSHCLRYNWKQFNSVSWESDYFYNCVFLCVASLKNTSFYQMAIMFKSILFLSSPIEPIPKLFFNIEFCYWEFTEMCLCVIKWDLTLLVNLCARPLLNKQDITMINNVYLILDPICTRQDNTASSHW